MYVLPFKIYVSSGKLLGGGFSFILGKEDARLRIMIHPRPKFSLSLSLSLSLSDPLGRNLG